MSSRDYSFPSRRGKGIYYDLSERFTDGLVLIIPVTSYLTSQSVSLYLVKPRKVNSELTIHSFTVYSPRRYPHHPPSVHLSSLFTDIITGAPVLKSVSDSVTGAWMDCHMMVADPARVSAFIQPFEERRAVIFNSSGKSADSVMLSPL